MPALLLGSDSWADVGDVWVAWVLTTTDSGVTTAPDAVACDLILPDGSADTGTVTAQTTIGLYKITYDVASEGEHRVAITVTDATYGDVVLTRSVYVRALTGSPPDLSEVWAYLGSDNSWTSEEVADALAAETAAQRNVCEIPADYPADLGQALKRRVARNLAARSVPVTSYTSFEGGATSTRVPKLDAEIARLEAPFPRLIAG